MSELDALDEKEALLGRVLGEKYRIEKVLGEGGVGVVYRAQHLKSNETVAVKVLTRAETVHPDVRTRFEREARALSGLTHPNIVGVRDFGASDTSVYFAMEYLEGRTLAQALSEDGMFSPARAVDLIRQILEGLSFAHTRGVLHRDLKPANVFLQKLDNGDDHIKLLDFGLAKILISPSDDKGEPTLTRDGAILGTPAYMAPEQASGGKVDLRADVYSVGVLFFEMLAGRCPFVGATYIDVLHGHLFEPVPQLSSANSSIVATPELEHLMQKAMAKSPEDRFTDAMDMLSALQGLSHPITMRPPSADGEKSRIALTSPPADLFTNSFPDSDASSLSRRLSLDETRPVRHYGREQDDPKRNYVIAGVVAALMLTAVLGYLAIAYLLAPDDGAVADKQDGNDRAGSTTKDSSAKANQRTAPKAVAVGKSGTAQGPGTAQGASATQKRREDDGTTAGKPVAHGNDSGATEDGGAGSPAGHPVLGELTPLEERVAEVLATGNAAASKDLDDLRSLAKRDSKAWVPRVLLGHQAFLGRDAKGSVRYYKQALRTRPEAQAYAPMLEQLVTLAGQDGVYRAARRLVRETYGKKALPTVDAAINDGKRPKKMRNRIRRLRKALNE